MSSAYGAVEARVFTGETIIVEGKIWRDEEGYIYAITNISNVEVRLPDEPDAYRAAKGAIKSPPGTELPEETIRRLRDA